MKKYKVNVNGTNYEIVLEVINENEISMPTPTASASTAKPPSSTSTSSEQILSPMPGNILAVNVSAGSIVKKGDVLMILEAMKMENEIMAPRDGKVTSVATSKGTHVESGTLLCEIE